MVYIYASIKIYSIVCIGQQVCFQSAMKQESDVSDMIGSLQVVGIYSKVLRKQQNYTYALYTDMQWSSFSLLGQ